MSVERLQKVIAKFKQKELERLANYILNQMCIMEVGLNPCSVGRGIYASKDITVPSSKEIQILNESLIELRENMLTPEEREILNVP